VLIDPLTTELEAALVRELVRAYEYANYARFRDRLRSPRFELVESTSQLGRWVPGRRVIELASALVLERPWPDVVGVLEHEMAHQFVDEVLGVLDETAHGETFRKVCAERGIDARAVGAPVAVAGVTPEPAHVLDRIRKLLALAGSPNQHEAELAMKKAHELMLRHNIEVARVNVARGFEVRYLGDPARRVTRVEADIVGLLAEGFFVKVIRVPAYLPRLGKRGSLYEIAGTPDNLAMACHVYEFLLATAARLWDENRRDARVRTGRDRIAYQCGVVRGFRERLLQDRTQLERGTGLVWVGDPQLDTFYRRRHPHITTRRVAVRASGAHQAGREAGSRVVLHKPVTSTGTGSVKRIGPAA
jgi:hypothetical protein